MSSTTDDDASHFLFALPYGSDFKTSSTRKMHIRQLNDVLHLSIQRGDLVRARRAWAILLRCKEYNWKTMWKTGLLLASDPENTVTGGEEKVEFLKKTMRQLPEQQEPILQELVLQLTSQNRFREALDELQLYLPSFPYQDNPILHLYAGLICFHLANHLDNEGSKENLLSQAKGHIDRSLALNPDEITAKAFLDETTTSLENVRNPTTEIIQDQGSDEEMSMDGGNKGSPAKRKRLVHPSS